MRHLTITVSFLLLCLFSFSQEKIILKFNEADKTVSFEDPKYEVLNHNESYQLILIKVNDAHISKVSQLIQSNYSSDIPEILKPIYSGITGNSDVYSTFGILQNKDKHRKVFLTAIMFYNSLEQIRELSENLYTLTKFKPNIKEAIRIKDDIVKEVNQNLEKNDKLKSIGEVNNEITKWLSFIEGLKLNYEEKLKGIDVNLPSSNVFFKEYSVLKNVAEKIAKYDYLNKVNFVSKSLNANDSIDLNNFIAKGDIVELKLKIYDTFIKDTIYTGSLSFETYGNFSFDFTTGFFYTNVVETKYYLQNRDEMTNDVSEEDLSNFDVSIGALGHFTYEFTPCLKGGISLGASLSPFDGHLRYLVGPSLIIGNKKQLAIGGGLAIANLNHLSDAVVMDDMGVNLPVSTSEIPLVKKIETGFFIGITYNLTSKKKEVK